MALKLKLSKAEFDKLSDELKEEYNKDKDGDGYTLDVDGLEDTGKLKRAADRVKAERDRLREQLTEATDTIADLEKNGAQSKDVKTLTAAHEARLKEETEKRDAIIARLRENATVNALDSYVKATAAKLSTKPRLIEPHIRAGLVTEYDEDTDTVAVKVKGSDGKPSSKSLEAFEKELAADKDFADIIIGSKASGGGAKRVDPAINGGAGHIPKSDGQPPDLSKMKPGDLVATLQARKEQAA